MTLMQWLTTNEILPEYNGKYHFFSNDDIIIVSNFIKYNYGMRELVSNDSFVIHMMINSLLDANAYQYGKLFDIAMLDFNPLERFSITTNEKGFNLTDYDEEIKGSAIRNNNGNDTMELGSSVMESHSGIDKTVSNSDSETKSTGDIKTDNKDTINYEINGSVKEIDTKVNTSMDGKRTYDDTEIIDINRTTVNDSLNKDVTNTAKNKDDIVRNQTVVNNLNDRTDSNNTTNLHYGQTINRTNSGQDVKTFNSSIQDDSTDNKMGHSKNDNELTRTQKGFNNIDYEGIVKKNRENALFSLHYMIANDIANNISLLSYNF